MRPDATITKLDRGRCSSCQAVIIWAVTAATSTAMPVDAKPHSDGNVTLSRDDVTGDLVATVLSPDDAQRAAEDGQPLRTSHFSTCPSAAWHRKSTRQRSRRR